MAYADPDRPGIILPRSIAWGVFGALLAAAASIGGFYMETRTKNAALTSDFIELKVSLGDLENRLEALERSESGQRAELRALAQGIEQNRKVAEANQALLRQLLTKSSN
jgi:uncharacterized coiled-coil protein SlyX